MMSMGAKRSFGQWLKQRRKALDFTQEELAGRVGCALVTIFKIEADQRRPSQQIASLLAEQLAIPPADRDTFVAFARSGHTGDSTAPWGTPFYPPTNLPTPPTPLIGRAQDITALRRRLLREDTQLLTLIGPPGIGKTRLSLAAADAVLDVFPDGVFLVLLAAVSDADLVPGVIAQTLGIQEMGNRSALEQLKHHLRDKHMLLVLDNFEQILPAAPQVAELLASCPLLKILVTSRAPLRVRRERQFPVSALALPDLNRLPEAETLPQYSALELFVERAQAVKPDFALTDDNTESVTAICTRLDGLPLAIELISARVRLLSPVALLERLHGRLMLQSDGLRDLEPRHRTLNAAIGWSYDLLAPEEKTLFMRLAVFLGGWTIEAAKAVCQAEGNILDGMASLLDKSLIQSKLVSLKGSDTRFTMLETIREYALDRLSVSGEEGDLRCLHAAYFLTLAQGGQDDTADRIDQDYDNLRSALGWCFSNDQQIGRQIALALVGYWIVRGKAVEGSSWLEQYLQVSLRVADTPPSIVRDLHQCAGTLAYFRDDLAAMLERAESLLVIAEQHHDPASRSYGLFFLGQDALHARDFRRAEVLFQEALILSQQAGTEGHSAGTLLMLGLAATGQGDYERAYAYNNESLALSRQQDNLWMEAVLLANNAAIKEQQGAFDEARALNQQSLRLSIAIDDKRTASQTIETLAELLSLDGDHLLAARLMGAAEALRDSIFATLEPLNHADHERYIAHIRANLSEAAFHAAWAEGRRMTLEEVLTSVLTDASQG